MYRLLLFLKLPVFRMFVLFRVEKDSETVVFPIIHRSTKVTICNRAFAAVDCNMCNGIESIPEVFMNLILL
jgi:hypothetical protein